MTITEQTTSIWWKLVSSGDRDRWHLHKTLGVLTLVSALVRFSLVPLCGHSCDMGFASHPVWTVPTLLVHGMLSATSFLFRVPSRRVKSGFQIWKEYRLHSVIFGLRSLLFLLLAWFEKAFKYDSAQLLIRQYGEVYNISVVLGAMALADYVSVTQKQEHSGFARNMEASPLVKYYFSCMQIAATAACVVALPGRFTTQFLFLFIIQGNAFLMTLRRRKVLSQKILLSIYGVTMLLAFCTILYEHVIIGGTAMLCVIGTVCNVAVLCRLAPTYWKMHSAQDTAVGPKSIQISKYIIWLVSWKVVSTVRPSFEGHDASFPLWIIFAVSETFVFAVGFRAWQNGSKVASSHRGVVDGGPLSARQDFGSRMVYAHRYHCHPINFLIHFATLPLQILVFWILPAIWALPIEPQVTLCLVTLVCGLYYSSVEIFVAVLLSFQTFLVGQVALFCHLGHDGIRAVFVEVAALLAMHVTQLFVGHYVFQGDNPAFEAFDAFCVLPFYLWAQILNWVGHVAFTEELGIPPAPIDAEIAPDNSPAFLHAKNYRNFCGNGRVGSVIIYYPAKLLHLVAIVQQSRKLGRRIRVVGKSHSYNKAVTCCDEDQVIVRTECLRRVSVDLNDRTATVEAGVTVGELDRVLARFNLCVPTNVILTSVTWGGIVSSGSHGSGYSPMCDRVQSLTLVDGRGQVRKLARDRDGDTFSAAVLSLGTCGLIYDMTVSLESMSILSLKDKHIECLPTSDELIQNAESLDQFEIFTFGSFVFRREWIKMKVDATVPTFSNSTKKWIMKVTGGFVWQIASWIMGQNFQAGYRLLSAASQGQSETMFGRVARVPDAIHFMERIGDQPSYSTEFALRVQDAPRAMAIAHEVRLEFEKQGINPMFIISECRLTPPGRSLLQPRPPTRDGEKEDKWMAWVEILGTKAYDKDERFLSFASQWCKKVIAEFPHALPHWGKSFEVIPRTLLKQQIDRNYGARLIAFDAERRLLDPDGIFLNDNLKMLLAPPVKRQG